MTTQQNCLREGVAVVTGGGSGLGLATARDLVERGSTVVILDLSRESAAVAEEIGATHIACDVADEDAMQAAVREASTHGAIRIAVSCAGGSGPATPLVADDLSPFPLKRWRRIMDLNVTGTMNLVRFAGAAMADTEPVDDDGQRGVMVLTSSIAGCDGSVGGAAYAASKAAVASLATSAARDLAHLGIRVAAIAPGPFLTPVMDHPELRAQVEELLREGTFPRRPGRPDEFAQAVAFIVDTSFMNGSCLRLDAGVRMW